MARANTKGRVAIVTPADSDCMDETNDAVRVNVVAGGAGGGAAQLAVRNAADTAWVNVGYQAGNLDVPVVLEQSLPAGTANIGDIDVLTQPARSRTVDAISIAQQTDALMSGLTALTPKFARINGAISGDNTLVAAVGGSKIRVLALTAVAAAAVTVNFQTAVAGAMLAGPFTLAANGGIVLPYNPLGWFETVAGDLLNIELSAAVTVGGCLTYVEV